MGRQRKISLKIRLFVNGWLSSTLYQKDCCFYKLPVVDLVVVLVAVVAVVVCLCLLSRFVHTFVNITLLILTSLCAPNLQNL